MNNPQPTQPASPGPSQTSRRDPKYERWRWQIFSITWLAYAGFYLTRKAFSVAKNELEKPAVMGMARGDMAWIDGANSVAYALGQFGFGALGDKLGPRIVVLSGMMLSVITADVDLGTARLEGLM